MRISDWSSDVCSSDLIEPFPSAVLATRYPNVPNHGDMTRFKEWPDREIDVLVGGTPCQSFSVAGLRGGLEDPRGSLMPPYLDTPDRSQTTWVGGAKGTGAWLGNRGRDFGTLLSTWADTGA